MRGPVARSTLHRSLQVRSLTSLVLIAMLLPLEACNKKPREENKAPLESEHHTIGSAIPLASPHLPPLQVVLSLTESWTSIEATVSLWSRQENGEFLRQSELFPAVVGKAGLGVGEGLEVIEFRDAPLKREGDGRAPAGVFALTSTFGSSGTAPTSLPYEPMSEQHLCVDDETDPRYGLIVAVAERRPRSFERMRRSDALYDFGVVVGHNEQHFRGKGSCIFLHRWRGPRIGTVGCTAMAPETLHLLGKWLDPAAKPRLLQLPSTELSRLRGELQTFAQLVNSGHYLLPNAAPPR